MLYKIVIQRVDYDDYPVGAPVREIGPFETVGEAIAFMNKFFPWNDFMYRRDNVPSSHTIFVDAMRLESPEDFG